MQCGETGRDVLRSIASIPLSRRHALNAPERTKWMVRIEPTAHTGYTADDR
jgi:hypothetical protein